MPPDEPTLPELRPELRLVRGAPGLSGEPSWLIHDPVQNKFVQIDAAAYRVLSRWRAGCLLADFVKELSVDDRTAMDRDALGRLVDFVHHSKLTVEPARDGWRSFAAERARSRRSPGSWLVHNYLFVRIPLFQPQAFLERTLPLANAVASRWVTGLLTLLGMAGLYLTSRQWDTFLATLPDIFTFTGIVLMGISLVFVKAAHELGHAYTAVRHGCRVPTMGIAFMLMAPLLYTDVTDSWRLTDRRKRLRIDSAGVRVELAIAALALFLWSFLPDGALRGLMFSLCTVSLVSSLFINLNPLMRFDGYYLLSELIGIENLQTRSFDLGTWRMREWLFGLGEPCPEALPARRVNFLVGYAWATWIYRLFLFLGIALIVYHFFFKALGIILFVVEIVIFIVRPVWNELKVWWKMKDRILRSRRSVATGGLVASLAALAIVPWSSAVVIPAVVEMDRMQPVFAKKAALISQVHVGPGQTVRKGDPILTLRSPDIEQELVLARESLKLARIKFARRGADAADRESSLVLEDQIRALLGKIAGLEEQRKELVLSAPFDGRILELNPELHPSRWIGPQEMIALVGSGDRHMARGYIAESDLWRIAEGATGRFIPDALQRGSLDIGITEIAVGSSGSIDVADLTSPHHGPIAAVADSKGRLVPSSARYLVKMKVTDDVRAPELAVRGVAIIDGARESLLARTWRQVLKVLVRESGA